MPHHLLFLREGEFNRSRLTDRGKRQMKSITDQLKKLPIMPERGFYVYSAPPQKYQKSALELARTFNAKVNEEWMLWNRGDDNDWEIEGLHNLIRRYARSSVLVLCTTENIAATYPKIWWKSQYDNPNFSIPIPLIGQALYINISERNCLLLDGNREEVSKKV